MNDAPILILASNSDVHLGYVGRYLDTEPVVVNVGALEAGLTYAFDGRHTWPRFLYGDRAIDLMQVRSVWYRQFNVRKLRPKLQIEPENQRDYAFSALTQLHEALVPLVNPGAHWVSAREAIRRAELKPLQLATAQLAGFHIPPTLFTSNADQARAFLTQHGRCVVKPLSFVMPEGYDQHTVVTDGTDLDLRGLLVTPHIFQPVIDPWYEVRVGTVRDKTFATKVEDTDENAGDGKMRDYRLAFGKGTLRVSPYRLPSPVSTACVDYLRRMGLVSGFTDLIRDRRGRYWFLETNPNGEWGFMDEGAIDGIARAIAHDLQS